MNSTALPTHRTATAADIPAIQRVRGSVLENRLTSRTIADDEVLHSITVRGRGWVVGVDGDVARSIGTAIDSGRLNRTAIYSATALPTRTAPEPRAALASFSLA